MLNKKRIKESYPKDVKDASVLIAYNPEKLLYYGSQAKKSMHLSSGDIDLLEPVNPKDSYKLASRIKQIVKNIEAKPLCYLGDFKSGIDPYYSVDIGKIEDMRVKGFDKKKVLELIKTRDFDKEAYEIASKQMTPKSFYELQSILRKKQVLRWGKDELKNGFKTIRGEKVYLKDTISNKDALTKIDTVQFIPSLNRFIEVTNYFDVVQDKEEFKDVHFINDLKNNLLKYYYEGNYFKFTKRMLSYFLLKKDSVNSQKLYDIVNGGLGIMYQVYNELKAIQYIQEHYKPPIDLIKQQLQSIKYKLGSIYEFEFDEKNVNKLIDSFQITKLIEELFERFNSITKKQLTTLGFLPIKSFLSPKKGGGFSPSRDKLQQISEEAYKSNPDSVVGDLNLIESTATLKFYKAPDNTIVVGIRGTKPTDSRDVKADGLIAVGQLESSARFKADLEALQRFQNRFPLTSFDYYGVGHSLGGAILDSFLKRGLVKSGVSYNPAVQPQDISNRSIQNHRVYATNDPLYKLMGQHLSEKPEVRAPRAKQWWEHAISFIPYANDAYDSYTGHQLDQFKGGIIV